MSASKKVSLTWEQLREGVRATFYPSVPTWDEAGQARIDRAVDRLLKRCPRRAPIAGRQP